MASMDQFRKQISAAAGRTKAKLVLKHAKIVNVFTETVEEGDIAMEDGIILGIGNYEGELERDLKGAYVCPGFLDGHIHLESSMVSPSEFERMVVPHGTCAVVTDPHEIANVAGTTGIRYMLEATKNLLLDVYFMMPSCVPSTALDESGAELHMEDLLPFYQNERVLGLAEMMNAYGVIQNEPDCIQKLSQTQQCGKLVDGHAPGLSGKALNAYVTAGVASDHECSELEEAKEKLSRGQWIMIRQGTAAKNLEKLIPLFEAPYDQRCMLVTDDKHPGDLIRGGHIDSIIREAVRLGADPIRAIKMGSLRTAEYFGLKKRGAVAPGYRADLVVVNDLTDLQVQQVYKGGVLVAEHGRMVSEHGDGAEGKAGHRAENTNLDKIETYPKENMVWDEEIQQRVYHSFHCKPIQPSDLALKKRGNRIRVIDLVSRELLTKERSESWCEQENLAPGVDPEHDVIKLAALERHKGNGHIGIGFLGNYGLKKGAVATSVGHDSHNLVIAGVTDGDMAAAGNRVIENEGGLAIAVDGKVLMDLPLPIAGLMSDFPVEEVDRRLETMKQLLRELGIHEEIDPFMTLGFVSLPVIPKLRLNTYGTIDVEKQQAVETVYSVL